MGKFANRSLVCLGEFAPIASSRVKSQLPSNLLQKTQKKKKISGNNRSNENIIQHIRVTGPEESAWNACNLIRELTFRLQKLLAYEEICRKKLHKKIAGSNHSK